MAGKKKKQSGGCLTIILLLVAIGGISSLFGKNNSRSNVASYSYSAVSLQNTSTPKAFTTAKVTATLSPTTTKLVTATPKKSLLSSSNGNVLFRGTYDKNNRPFNGTYSYESNGAIVERNIINGTLTNELAFVSNNTFVTGLLSNENTIEEVTIIYENEDKYIGHIVNGKKRGQGKYYWTNGAWYEGSWYNDTMSGKGKYYFSADSSRYYLEGIFLGGVPYGRMTYVSEQGISYITTWENGKCISAKRK